QVVFENASLEATLRADGGMMARRAFHLYGGTNFPLTALVFNGPEMSLEIENDRDQVGDGMARRLLAQFAALLESLGAHPDATVGELSMVPEAERAEMNAWNDTAVPFPPDATLV